MARPHASPPVGSASRRQFLRKTAALATAGVAASLSLARSAYAAGSDTLRLGLVGCGGRGTGAAVNALDADPGTKVVALADAFPDRVESSLQRLKKSRPDRVAVDPDHCFAGFDACDKLLASGVDVVLLATPPHFRPMHLAACVAAGKHVFCEKPMAVDAPGVRSVSASCEEAKKKNLSVLAGLCCRHHTGIQETMKRVQDGAIGRIVAVQETYNVAGPWFRNKQREPGWTEMEYQMRNWYPFTWLSGDHNVAQHVHSLAKACWALGDRPPVKAWGLGGRQVRSATTIGNIFDHHAVVYEYSDGVRVYSFCRRQDGCANEVSDQILGTRGRAELIKGVIEGDNPWRYQGPKCNMHEAEHVVLFRALRQGKTVNDGSFMTLSTLMAILGRMVTYTGQTITWEQAAGSKESLSPARYAWDADPPILPEAGGGYPLAVPGVTRFV